MSCRHVQLLSGLIEYFLNIFGTSMSMSLSLSVSSLTSVFGAVLLPHPRLLSTCHISHDACHSLPRTTLCFIHCCCYWRCCCCYCNLYVLFILCQFNATLTLTHSPTLALTLTCTHTLPQGKENKRAAIWQTIPSMWMSMFASPSSLSLSLWHPLSLCLAVCVCECDIKYLTYCHVHVHNEVQP